jgi:hypothetical protein
MAMLFIVLQDCGTHVPSLDGQFLFKATTDLQAIVCPFPLNSILGNEKILNNPRPQTQK